MSKLLKLNKEFEDMLTESPESGMGYHKVTVFTKSGKALKERIINNCKYLVIEDDEKLNNNNILKIEVENERTDKK